MKNLNCQIISEEIKKIRESKDNLENNFTEAKATIGKLKSKINNQEDQISKLEKQNGKQEEQLSNIKEETNAKVTHMEKILKDLILRGKDLNDFLTFF